MKANILRGIRVLDFSRVLAGPYVGRIFADFGAEVIKLQSRRAATGAEENREDYFRTWNRNKRSITLNMAHPEAAGIFRRLVGFCDVLIENFSPRVMSNWGLGYEKLREVRPDLIMLSLSGMGQSGPWRDYTAYASTIHALGGLTYLTSYGKEHPMGPGFSYGDILSGLYGAFALLAALEYRERTGEGQYIDLSEYEAICSLIGPALMETASHGNRVNPEGNTPKDEPAAPCGCYKCQGEDRWCVLAVHNESEWRAFCKVIDPALERDERFSSPVKRKASRRDLDALIEVWTRKRTVQQVVQLLQEAGVPSGVVQDARELAEDPQHKARDFFVEFLHSQGYRMVSDRTPLLAGSGGLPEWKAAPLLGEDNLSIYVGLLGMSEEEYRSNVREGVIA